MRILKYLLIAMLLSCTLSLPLQAANVIRIGFAELPGIETHPHEILILNLLEAIEQQDFIDNVEVVRVPFARSIVELARGSIDAHLPMKYDPQDVTGAEKYMLQFGTALSDFTYSNENLFKVKFVIISLEENRIAAHQAAELNILTDISHVAFFKNQFGPSHCMKCSLAEVQQGVLDGYLFEEQKVEQALQGMDFVDHRMNSYGLYDVRFLVQNNKRGEHIRELLDRALANLKATGEFDRIMAGLIAKYGY